MGHHSLEAARQRLGLSDLELWIDYFALGGNLASDQLGQYLRGTRTVSEFDHNLVIHALNERFRDRGENGQLAYSSA